MKHTSKLLLLLAVSALFAFLIGCKGPEGPAGKDGATGAPGLNAGFVYFEGFADSLRCQKCHTADYDTTYRVIAKQVEYEASGHFQLGNYDRNTTACAGCHTNEGFFERTTRGVTNETFTDGVASGPIVLQNYYNSSPVGCFTCHSPHKRGNFSLRDTTGTVKIFSLVAGQATVTFNGSTTAKLCVKCHQPRMSSTFRIPGTTPVSWKPDPTKNTVNDTAKIYTLRWNNHVSGEVTQTLLGTGGFEFSNAPGNPDFTADSYHTTLMNNGSLDCADCHMAQPIGNKGGGHTFKVGYTPEGSTTTSYNLAGCNLSGCHTGLTTSDATHWKIRDEIIGKTAKLAALMMDTTITKKWSLPKSGKAVAWVSASVNGTDTTWSVAASSTSPLVIIPADKAGALWNLQQVVFEKSHGIHNYKYVKTLLDASIAELTQ